MDGMNFIQSQCPIVKILNVFGFFAYKPGSKASSSRCRHIYCIIFNTIWLSQYFFASVLVARSYSDLLHDGSQVTYLIQILEVACNGFNSFTILYSIIFTQNSQMEASDLIMSIENELKFLPFTSERLLNFNRFLRKRCFVIAISCLCYSCAMEFIYGYAFYEQNSALLVFQIINCLLYTSYFAIILSFVLHHLMKIRHLFFVINVNLKSFMMQVDLNTNDIQRVLRIHDKLCESIEIFGEAFGIILFGAFVYTFGLSSCEFYFAFNFVENNPSSMGSVAYVLANVIWLFPQLYLIRMIGSEADRVQVEIQETKNIFSKTENSLENNSIVSKYLVGALQLDANFTANGLFHIDGSLFYNVVTAVITFLVIMLQFKQAEKYH